MRHRRTARAAAPLMALILLGTAAGDDFVWKLRKDKDGITVWTRKVPGSGSLEFRAVTEIQATMPCMLALMEDVKSYTRIFPSVKEARLLGITASRDPVLYQRINVPPPAKDRDTVVRISFEGNGKTGAVTLRMTSLWDYIPERKNIVRVKKVAGYWEFVPDAKRGVVKVTYRLHNDPGGDLPPWLVNVAVVKRPYNVLRKLKRIAREPAYRDARPKDLRLFKLP